MDGVTDYFNIRAGVLQGDTLAPFLFILVLDHALRKAIGGREEELRFPLVPRKSQRVPSVTITDLDFVDDIALVSNTIEQAQDLLLSAEHKTKVIAYNISDPPVYTRNGTHLGSWINSSEKDLKTGKGQAWSVLHSMKKVW